MKFLFFVETFFSGMLPFVFLVVAGVYFTFKTKGYQFRKFFYSFKFCLSPKNSQEGGVSSFGAVCNSLSATVGTANIAGVAAAISLGGAGAVFWMWVSAVLSMVIKSCEITASVKYRKKQSGKFWGGPMLYMKTLGKRFSAPAFVFCVAGVFSALGTGNITQVNACVVSISDNFLVKLGVGVCFCLIVFFIIVGGVDKITRFTSKVLPVMSVLYILLCFGIILKNRSALLDAFFLILKGAFSPKAVTGGAVGSVYTTLITGAQKGIFSNEAGMGTAGLAHAEAYDADAKTQGLFGLFEVFVDTLLICTLTALTILCSGVIIDYKNVESSGLVGVAFSTLYGKFGAVALSVMLCLFGISSVIGWAAYGIRCAEFLKGEKAKKIFIRIYPLFCVLGALINVGVAFRISEFANGIMLIVNVFALLLLPNNAWEDLRRK